LVEVAFQSDYGKSLSRIVIYSLIFHFAVGLVVVGFAFWRPYHEEKKIPIFNIIQLPPPKGVHHRHVLQQPAPQPVPEPVKAEPKPEVKPIPKPAKTQLAPEPKPQPKLEPKPVIAPVPEPAAPPAPAAPTVSTVHDDDFDLPSDEPEGERDGMALPNMDQLRAVGDLEMDPLMQVYLEQLQMILMQNFSPPSGLNIPRGSRTSVQFTIQRNGQMTGVLLKKSSGNAIWDRMAMRAVNLSHLPPLPPNYRAMVLPLVFDFKEK